MAEETPNQSTDPTSSTTDETTPEVDLYSDPTSTVKSLSDPPTGGSGTGSGGTITTSDGSSDPPTGGSGTGSGG